MPYTRGSRYLSGNEVWCGRTSPGYGPGQPDNVRNFHHGVRVSVVGQSTWFDVANAGHRGAISDMWSRKKSRSSPFWACIRLGRNGDQAPGTPEKMCQKSAPPKSVPIGECSVERRTGCSETLSRLCQAPGLAEAGSSVVQRVRDVV